jgi:hypothetical protein
MKGVKGYKVFNPDWTCRGFKYEVGETYEMDGAPIICVRGFHFCKQANDCFSYYRFNPNNKVAEVIAMGDIVEKDDKCCTNKIQIVREITWEEVLTIVNTGKACTGFGNSGDCNSGHRNSGNYNSGNWNSGNWNSGHCNSGNRNSGDYNSGNCNSGNCNSGNYNSGHRNSGDFNRGDWNSGDWNIASNVVGCFNTENQKLRFFDKETDMTFEEWRNSEACLLMNRINFRPTDWIWEVEMSEAEKAEHPEYKTTGGYLKIRDYTDCCKEWWNGLTEREKQVIKNIPNFDAEKFFIITGIKVEH